MEKLGKIGFFRSLDTRDLFVAGVQAGAPGKCSQSVIVIVIVFILVFLVGHPRFTCRRCPNLNLVEISLSLSRLKSIHVLQT